MQKHMSAAAKMMISFTVGGQKYCVFAFMVNQTVTRHQRYFTDLLAMHFIRNYLYFLLCLWLLTHQHITTSQNLTILDTSSHCFVLVFFFMFLRSFFSFSKVFCRMFFVNSQNVMGSLSLSTLSVLMRPSSWCPIYFNSSVDMPPTPISLILLKKQTEV